MLKSIFVGPQGIRAGWRFLLFVLGGFALGRGLDWLITHPLGYHYSPGWNPYDFMIDGASTLAVAVFVAWVLSRIEHRNFEEYGLTRRGAFGGYFWQGVLWGFVPSVVIVLMIWAAGGATFHGWALSGRALLIPAASWAVAMLLLAFAEEFLYRGYSQYTLATGMGFWPAAVLLSVVFGAIHYFLKPMESWRDGVSVGLYLLFWCLTVRRTGSLWFAIGFHAISDYTDMVIFAEPNTGNNGQLLPGHLFNVSYHGPDWLTGGPCGTEASAFVFLILAGLFLLFHRRYPSRSSEEVRIQG
jgi:membrane protease YdiL (CAAX protease family)